MINTLLWLIVGSIITPNSTSVWSVNHTNRISWDNPGTMHVQLEMLDTEWKSTIDGISFLTAISDNLYYDWNIPTFMSQYWEFPKRIKLTDLQDNNYIYSDIFNTTGLKINQINNNPEYIFMEWTTNSMNKIYNIYLYPNSTNYFSFKLDDVPIETISLNYNNNKISWSTKDVVEGNYVFVVETVDRKNLDISEPMFVKYEPTTPTTTLTSGPTTSSINTTRPDLEYDTGSILAIVFGTIIGFICLIGCFYGFKEYYCSDSKIHPGVYVDASWSKNPLYRSPQQNCSPHQNHYYCEIDDSLNQQRSEGAIRNEIYGL